MIVTLHRGQCLIRAKEMTVTQHACDDGVIAKVFLGHLDPAQGAVGHRMHVVVQNECLKADTEQCRHHARAFIDQITPRERCGQRCHPLFHTVLGVDCLGVRHGCGDAGWQAKPV